MFSQNVILFRKNTDNKDEYNITKTICKSSLYQYRTSIPLNSLVIGRYSVLPLYEELETELNMKNSMLINNYDQHMFIATMEYYFYIKDFTPITYFNKGYINVPDSEHGWIVKGKTNSRKHQWNSHMFAKTREHLKTVMNNLYDDILIADQGLVIREYVPLQILDYDIFGLPYSLEYRLFYYKNNLIDGGFYWINYEHYDKYVNVPIDGIEFGNYIANILKDYVNFFVIDIAKTQNNEWIVVEINDAQMAGLSSIDPISFYKNLKKMIIDK